MFGYYVICGLGTGDVARTPTHRATQDIPSGR